MTKIILDKVESFPPHALDRQAIKSLIDVIPQEWGIRLFVVHLKATSQENRRFERPIIYSSYSNRLNVSCRGLDPKIARREILRELAINGLNIQTRMLNRLSDDEMKNVDEIISPLLKKAEILKFQ